MPLTTTLNDFLAGAIFTAYVVITLLFWRSWQQTGDRLFKFFAAAFLALGIERLILLAFASNNESIHLVYVVRLLAFSMIIWGIVEKNRSPQP